MNPQLPKLGLFLLVFFFSGSALAAGVGQAQAGVDQAPMELKVEFQKGLPCAVRLLHDEHWLLEFAPPDGPKSTLRLPLRYSGNIQVEELREAAFISPDKRELFISFVEVRNGRFSWAYVVDFSNGAAGILFDSDWLMPGFAAQGSFEDFYRVKVVFPELFDEYMLFISDGRKDAYALLYDDKTGSLNGKRDIVGSYSTRSQVIGPDKQGLFVLETAVAVAGAMSFDLLGEYAFRLRCQDGKWRLQGDTLLTVSDGIDYSNRVKQGATPVADLRLAVTAQGLEKSLPPPLAYVKKINKKSELDALAGKLGVTVAGKFVADAEDTWFFLPNLAPLTFTVHAVSTLGGDSEAADLIESYMMQEGQGFVYSGDWQGWDEETESMNLRFVIGASHEPSGQKSFLWLMPESENDSYCPGFAPLKD